MAPQKSDLADPRALGSARAVAHSAVQILAKAARANLSPRPDGSHASVAWSNAGQQFLSPPLSSAGNSVQLGLHLTPFSLALLQAGEQIDEFLLAGQTVAGGGDWVDAKLLECGLEPATPVTMPYALPEDVAAVQKYRAPDDVCLVALAGWYSLAEATLNQLANTLSKQNIDAGAVLCWPHHFDIATYVALESGDAETARGIGVGFSPGDGYYDQPYFYVNPWPQPEIASLPPAIAPGRWHVQDFVGAVATAEDILSLDVIEAETFLYLRRAFAAGQSGLE